MAMWVMGCWHWIENMQKVFSLQDFSSSVTAYSLDRFTRDLLDSYKKQDTDRKEKLHVYRNTVGRDVLRTKLFCPTRVLIFADATLCLSNANLNLHTRLKAWV